MIVLDASVVIALLDDRDVHHGEARRVLREAGTELLAMSPISIAEVLVGPTRAGRASRASRDLADLGVAETPLGSPRRLAALRVETGLRMPDCCVLLAAEDADGADVATFDDRLASVARARGLRLR